MDISDLLAAADKVLQPGVSDALVKSTLISLEKALRRYQISPKQRAKAALTIGLLKERLASDGTPGD